MTTKWRFDQGRGKYHAFDNVVKIAKAMVSLDGKNPRDVPCPIKGHFSSINLDFPPDDPSYPAWRNYARTFSLLMLVPTGRDISVIEPTDLCREIAKGTKGKVGNFDEYLHHLIGHWIYPNPAFEDYSNSHPKVFPLLAILKLLTSKLELGLPPRLSVDEIFELLIFNNVSGNENASFYKTLKSKAGSFGDDEKRQVRELLKFISQGTYFNWSDDSIHLTISLSEASNLQKSIPLFLNKPSASRKDQLVTVSKLTSSPISFTPPAVLPETPEEREFVEGNKVRAYHLRTERNPKLRRDFLKSLSKPYQCDFCEKSMGEVYPWSKDFIEVHHLLPLASAVKIGKTSTSFEDLVPLCPNCHRAVHYAYSDYLDKSGKDDFDDKEDAISCYENAKKHYILNS